MNNLYAVITSNGNITTNEIQHVLDRGQTLLADMAIAAGYEKLYLLDKDNPCKRTLLYLYLYAIESWSSNDNSVNYMTTNQLKKVMSAIEQLFCDCAISADNC